MAANGNDNLGGLFRSKESSQRIHFPEYASRYLVSYPLPYPEGRNDDMCKPSWPFYFSHMMNSFDPVSSSSISSVTQKTGE